MNYVYICKVYVRKVIVLKDPYFVIYWCDTFKINLTITIVNTYHKI